MPILAKQAPLFLFLTEENKRMTRFFERGTALAEMERQMMMVPNFTPRGHGRAILCRYHLTAADVDCRNCLEHRRRGCRSLTCLYLSERLKAGAVTMEELIAETVRPWKYLPLKQRAMGVIAQQAPRASVLLHDPSMGPLQSRACQANGFHFDGQLHIMRMLEMMGDEKEYINSRWLAAVYLLSARAALWQKTIAAVRPNQINFASVRLGDCPVQEYVLYRAAKGICSGTLGATSEELADPELVSDDTLRLILCAAATARYGPDAMRIGRSGKDADAVKVLADFSQEV